MKIIVTGATGFVGTELIKTLVSEGYSPVVITRDKIQARKQFPQLTAEQFIELDLNRSVVEAHHFTGVMAVIHLAGESIDGRWTDEKKKRILQSRVQSTKNILQNLPKRGMTFITASAQGIYGDQGDSWISEDGSIGDDFLARVCLQWEEPSKSMQMVSPENRVVQLRFGMVLSPQGGALAKMLKIYRANLGAVVGTGNQWISWISLFDLCQVIVFALRDKRLQGPVNVSTDSPVRHAEWTQILCRHLNVHQMPRVPSLALKMLLGEMSAIALTSIRMKPQVLLANGFQFKYRDLAVFLKNEVPT